MFFPKLSKSIFCATICISFFLRPPYRCFPQQPITPPAVNIDATTADIVQVRTFTSQYVLLANSRFKSDSPEYAQAYKLYAKAYSNYSAWNSYLTSAIRAGRTKHLPSDPKYTGVAANASQSATAFTNYVDEQTSQSKAVTTIITALASLGIDLWTKWSNKISADRAAAATAFATDTKWQSWNEIISGKPPGTAKPEPKAITPPGK
jgi:hypothetical protein